MLLSLACQDTEASPQENVGTTASRQTNDRSITDTGYLPGSLTFALQEDGVGEQLWRDIPMENVPVLYDPDHNRVYVKVMEAAPSNFGIVFPDSLITVDQGWRDETGFPYTAVIEQKGDRYVDVMELAEKNGAFAYLENASGDVRYFPATLLRFMHDNYYADAPFAGRAWRHVWRQRERRSNH